jgi:hypothetical protein
MTPLSVFEVVLIVGGLAAWLAAIIDFPFPGQQLRLFIVGAFLFALALVLKVFGGV